MMKLPTALVPPKDQEEDATTDSGCSDGASENMGDPSKEEGSKEEEIDSSAPASVTPPRKFSGVFPTNRNLSEDEITLHPEQTLILLDWDDTVMPSSWVTRRGLALSDDSIVTFEQSEQLEDFAKVAIRTIITAKKLGTVVLVTNAETGWIELSCRKFLPSLYPEIETIPHMSARSAYEPLGVTSPLEWKSRAFKAEIAKFFGEETNFSKKRNVISLGDSGHERDAVMTTTACFRNSRTKSLKLLERPELGQLKEEHQLINSFFQAIAQYDGHLDLCIRCS